MLMLARHELDLLHAMQGENITAPSQNAGRQQDATLEPFTVNSTYFIISLSLC